MKTATFISFVTLLACSQQSLYSYYTKLDKKTDVINFSYATFIIIIIHTLFTFYRSYNQEVSTKFISAIRVTYSLIHTVVLPFYASEIFSKYNTFKQANYIPAAFGSILGLMFMLVENPKESFVDLCLYGTGAGLVYAGQENQNLFVAVAGLIYVLGEYILIEGKSYFDIPPTTLFNFFLAAFTVCASLSLTVDEKC